MFDQMKSMRELASLDIFGSLVRCRKFGVPRVDGLQSMLLKEFFEGLLVLVWRASLSPTQCGT